MAAFINSSTTIEKMINLPQGFWLEKDIHGMVIMTLKFDTAILTELLKGCPIKIAINKKNSQTTVLIEDDISNPFYVTGENFSEKDTHFIHFESIIIDIVNADKIGIVYFNDSNYHIFYVQLDKKNDIEDFKNWLSTNNNDEFLMALENYDVSTKPKLTYIDNQEAKLWGEKWAHNKPAYNFNDFLADGKHGYNQEIAVRKVLSMYYDPNKELFHSPFKTNDDLPIFFWSIKKQLS